MRSERGSASTIVLVVLLVAIGALLWLGVQYISKRTLLSQLPDLPELQRYSPAVQRQLTDADAAARRRPRAGEAVGELAMAYHANAFNEQARVAYLLAMKVDPKNARWPHLLGVLETVNGENERAITFLGRAAEVDDRNAHTWARLGQLYFRRQANEEAEQAFRRALEVDPTHPHAAAELGRLLLVRGKPDESVTALEPAIRAYPQFGPAQRVLALAYEQLGRTEEQKYHEELGSDIGLQMLDPLVHELYGRSSTGDILITQAQIAQSWGHFDRALPLLRRAVSVAPDERDVQLAMGRFLALVGGSDRARLTEALGHLRAALKLDPTHANTRHDCAQTLLALGDTTAAVAEWERILSAETQHAMACMGLGQVAFAREKYDEARAYFRRGLGVAPDTPYMLGNRGMGYRALALTEWKLGRFDAAVDAFEDALAADPRFVDTYADWANILRERGREEDGVAIFRRGLQKNQADPKFRLSFGNFLLQGKRFSEAKEQLLVASRLSPRDPRPLAALGYVTLEAGNADEAISYLEGALRLDPNSFLAHFHLGNALLRNGRQAEAVSHYEAALRLRPGFVPAREALDRLRSRGG